jgi:hypothetical protein
LRASVLFHIRHITVSLARIVFERALIRHSVLGVGVSWRARGVSRRSAEGAHARRSAELSAAFVPRQ